MEKHPLHLKIPDLQTSDEVEKAVEKQERLTGEDLPNDPGERIEAYMDRLENVFLNKDERVRERNLEMLRPAIYDAFLIKPDQVPESYFELQQQVARERGQPVENIPQNVREQMISTAIEDQKHSLDQWLDYLTSEDAVYPTWFKYFVFRNITKLSQFDKALGKFKDRTPTTVAPYPDVYREPLAKICDLYEKVKADNKKLKDPEVQALFSKKFPKLYAELITESLASKIENKEEIKGEWVKYEQGQRGEAEKLYKSLEGKGTGWCTAGHSTAEMQVESGDFYVYYTYNTNGDLSQPRIAIRMNGQNEIGEIRGILEHQTMEPLMQDVLDKKLKDFGPEAEKYQKKSADMKRLTEIDNRTKENKSLSKADLLFLYEVNSSIDGFGYDKDPRIEEIRSKRDLKEDMPILFDCQPEQIATKEEDITPNIVAYIGEWNLKVLNKIPKTVENIYTKFPEKKVFLKEIALDPEITSAETAIQKLKNKGHDVGDYAKDMLTKVNWEEKLQDSYKIVSFSVGELFGDTRNHTYADIKTKAQENGLELIPAALAPEIREQYPKNGDYTVIAMEAIRDRDGFPVLFDCNRYGSKSWLRSNYGRDGTEWNPYYRFFFARK
jgi:hypothetical protein